MFFRRKTAEIIIPHRKKEQNTFKLTAPGPSHLCMDLPEKQHLTERITKLHTVIQNA